MSNLVIYSGSPPSSSWLAVTCRLTWGGVEINEGWEKDCQRMREHASFQIHPTHPKFVQGVIRMRLDQAHSDGQYCSGWLYYSPSAPAQGAVTQPRWPRWQVQRPAAPTSGTWAMWTATTPGRPSMAWISLKTMAWMSSCSAVAIGNVSWLQYIVL